MQERRSRDANATEPSWSYPILLQRFGWLLAAQYLRTFVDGGYVTPGGHRGVRLEVVKRSSAATPTSIVLPYASCQPTLRAAV
jgi:hypothetical protein